MVFSSFIFLFLFLTLLLAVYFLIPRRLREARNAVLLASSLFFYLCGGPRYLPLMLCSIAVNYAFGLLCASRRRWTLAAAVAANLLLLGWFKYAGFLARLLNGLRMDIPVPEIVLPVGISFFTFQGLSYVIDVYRGEARPQRNILRVALYISLFPQLVAGPIVRYAAVAGELLQRRESLEDFAEGALRFTLGLGKKMLLANNLGLLADEAFSALALSAGAAWLGAAAYTGQIYFDFSGYSDMAIGLGRMLGFRFAENFNYPYISRSVTEFWRRWHMSLGGWFRDYVYIPLGGSRCGRAKQVRNVAAVWLLTGLWHGAAWNFVLWGGYFGLLLLGERFVWRRPLAKAPPAARHIYTMLLVILGWVLFRCESLTALGSYLGAMLGRGGGHPGQSVYFLRQYGVFLAAGAAASLPVKDWAAAALERRGREGLLCWGPPALGLLVLLLSFLQLVSSTFNPFIYYRF